MTTSALAMRNPWRRRGSIAPGGTVLGIAFGAPGQVWLATAAGLWLLMRLRLGAEEISVSASTRPAELNTPLSVSGGTVRSSSLRNTMRCLRFFKSDSNSLMVW